MLQFLDNLTCCRLSKLCQVQAGTRFSFATTFPLRNGRPANDPILYSICPGLVSLYKKPPDRTTIFVSFQFDQFGLSSTVNLLTLHLVRSLTPATFLLLIFQFQFLLTHLSIYLESLESLWVELRNDFYSHYPVSICQLWPFYQDQTKRETKLCLNKSWEAIHHGSLSRWLYAVYSFAKMPSHPQDANVDNLLYHSPLSTWLAVIVLSACSFD